MKNHTYIVNHWSIDLISGFITHQVTQEQKRLGEYQLKLLSVLLEHVGHVLSHDQLTHLVWKRRVIGHNSLPNAIHRLRAALDDKNKQQRIIQTIPKMGYLLDPTFCEIFEKITEAELEASTEPVIDHQELVRSITPPQKIEITLLAANTSENEHTAVRLEKNNHALLPMSSATNPLQRIFSSRRLLAGLVLITMIIAGFSYLLLQ